MAAIVTQRAVIEARRKRREEIKASLPPSVEPIIKQINHLHRTMKLLPDKSTSGATSAAPSHGSSHSSHGTEVKSSSQMEGESQPSSAGGDATPRHHGPRDHQNEDAHTKDSPRNVLRRDSPGHDRSPDDTAAPSVMSGAATRLAAVALAFALFAMVIKRTGVGAST